MESNTAKNANAKNDTQTSANTTSANHSAPQQAKTLPLKKRKRRAPAHTLFTYKTYVKSQRA